MVLCIDIGNRTIAVGCVKDGEITRRAVISTDRKTDIEYAVILEGLFRFMAIQPRDISGAAICSAVPPITGIIASAVRLTTGAEPVIVSPGVKTGVNIKLENPLELGADIVAAAAGALKLYNPPIIIIDMGTATTLTVIDGKGNLTGGAIMPGVISGLAALSSSASLLPDIGLQPPKKAIGRNTVESMRSGAVLGTASMLDGMLRRMTDELGEHPAVVATGSIANMIIPHCENVINVDDNLLMKGLYAIYMKNR